MTHVTKPLPANLLENKFLLLLLPILALAPILGLAEKASTETITTPALTVTLIQPQQTVLPLKISANGNVVAWQEAIIGSESNGLRLTQVLVNVGDVVKKGQLLATFSAESIEAELNQAKASLMEAEAQGREAINNSDRARTLQNTGAMSNQQIDQYTTAADTSKARIEVAKASVVTQEIRLKNTKIYAPDNGVISSRNATVGAVISTGSELFKLIRQSRLEWRAEVVSSDLAKIKAGMQVNVVAADGSSFKGKVRMISPTVDTQTRNALIYVDLPANSPAKAGMYAKGEFILGKSSTLALPQQVLVLRDGFTYVFTVTNINGKKIAKQVKVKTGRRVGNLVEIISGIEPNQQLVATGGAFLSDNDLVKIAPQANTKK
ncbi:efflux RND transporter periplasmic adaptor subunit [Methylotenera versatilis]|uniref:Efflux transporter, RND family, MFP subunit n=1 Tax=Methylotenera versatilis (strain 301) TaxID=666681 RepID=D7DJB5_METV0|nr:efflux RND transporter periplasmic adaptor subunit [Methylotenera versatilis]ADI30150.1 efflux transporter, RND family, MFP subunit [Methylotenera versatilis 301]